MSLSMPTDSSSTTEPRVRKGVHIDAPIAAVWAALTLPRQMKVWMFPSEIEIVTDWQVGGSIEIRGDLHGLPFVNTGRILAYHPMTLLKYSHRSSVSHLADEPGSYSEIAFELAALDDRRTSLTVTVSHFPNDVIYRHLAHYWTVTPEVLKRHVEEQQGSTHAT